MVITVTQLNNYIKPTLEFDEILQNVTVCGEVTNLKLSHGNYYFSLKDKESQIDCFAYSLDLDIAQGMQVEISGAVNYLSKYGKISFLAKKVVLAKKLGEQYLKFLELKEKLTKEGLFDDAHKKLVPNFCKKIGVVTSKDGAVIEDIKNIVLRRQPFSNIFLYPVHVQGEFAEQEIVDGIKYFNDTDVDVVIVGRGGGSSEDLSVFNSESIVRAIYNSNKPIVSSVGHGVDFTLSDFVADIRAVTPSEAAEFVTTDVVDLKNTIFFMLNKVNRIVTDKYNSNQLLVESNIKQTRLLIDNKIYSYKNAIHKLLNSIKQNVENKSSKLQYDLEMLLKSIDANNPTKILQKGYAIVTQNDSRVKSVKQLKVNSKINLLLNDGQVSAIINKIEEQK